MAALLPVHTKGLLEAGCDEAGRGCLAGPVVAAAVILPPRLRLPGLHDSKKLDASARDELRILIEQRAVAWAVGFATPEEIDAVNILRASFLAMHRAIDQLRTVPEHLLVDGNRFAPYHGIRHTCLVRGDGRYRAIAAASILAKTHRDEWMCRLASELPAYGWSRNKGYPTEDHRQALHRLGPTPHHRRTFRWVRPEPTLF